MKRVLNDNVSTNQSGGVQRTSVGNNSLLASITASSTDVKRIQTPHISFRDLGADKTFRPIGQAAEFNFESKFKPLPGNVAGICQSLPKTIEGLTAKTAKSMAELLGQHCGGSVPVGRASTNTERFRVGCSRCGQRMARLRKKGYHSIVPLLRYWLSSRINYHSQACDTDLVQELKKVFMLCRFWAVTTDFQISMEFAKTCYWPKQRSLLRSIFRSFICLWLKIRHRS